MRCRERAAVTLTGLVWRSDIYRVQRLSCRARRLRRIIRAMVMLVAIGGLLVLWLVLSLMEVRWRRGLLTLESQHSPEMAAIWLRVASGYRLVLEDAPRGVFVWEQGRRFHDGGIAYYGEMWRDPRTGRARFILGVIGHKFHTAGELAAARSRLVATQIFHLTGHSAADAIVRAANPRTALAVHPALRRLAGKQADRPPAIDAPMSPTAVRFSLRVPLGSVVQAIAELSPAGWRLVETASLSRGLVAQHRYCLRDAAQGKDAGPEYLLEVCGYASGWAKLAIDWFPRPGMARSPRRPAALEADLRQKVERLRRVPELAE